jgi:hypothetical protein
MGNLSNLVLVRLGVRRKSALTASFAKCSNYHISNKSVLSTTFTARPSPNMIGHQWRCATCAGRSADRTWRFLCEDVRFTGNRKLHTYESTQECI